MVGCAPSEEEVRAEFEKFVSSRRACALDADCVLAAAGCPLGCTAAVNREHQAAVEAKARELIEDYESGGAACDYECVSEQAACVERLCTGRPLE